MNKNEVKLSQLTLNTNDQEQFPTAQVMYMGKVCNVVLLQPYGLIGRAPVKDSLVTLFNQQGSESARLGIASCPQKRHKGMVEGEVGLQNVVTGCIVTMDKDGNLNINVPKDINATVVKNVNITAIDVNMTINDLNINAHNISIIANTVDIKSSTKVSIETPLFSLTATNANITATTSITGVTSIKGATAITGNLTVTGNVATVGTLTNNGINVGSTHTHGGVQSGGSNTHVPN